MYRKDTIAMASNNKQARCFILLTIIVFALTHLCCDSSAYGGQPCNEHLPTREFFYAENMELHQVSYRQKITRSHVICVNYCLSDPDCKSVNYHINNHLCELNKVTRTQYPDNFITHYGSVYFDADVHTPLYSVPDQAPSTQPDTPSPSLPDQAPSTQPDTPSPSLPDQSPSTQPDTPSPFSAWPSTLYTAWHT